MKKWLVYFMIVTYLASFCEMRQVAKLPNLIEHYISHKIENPDISVFAFLKMHYLDEQKIDKDYDQDMKLPFKTHDLSSISIVLNIPPEKTTFTLQHQSIYVDVSSSFSYSEKFYPSVFQKIWEPPKI
ncbi:hypothetical protein Q73A0000_02355 [Kaistella flava (ex Peng et al. 2021)]|uniref:Uncharacterized protein n=1 Tax=Kaistella flava (ex Peng et al. 2021) TaxID=2038776 RepID=A0A7M2Y587_9FLAO|nr:hypothetical protein [Kaistella flava (ex Peng et al. 2021)]QOW09280.1 hypothetical protein Q73A0000_02355 [Kaistella flava (ex Peng et al. 2021)]